MTTKQTDPVKVIDLLKQIYIWESQGKSNLWFFKTHFVNISHKLSDSRSDETFSMHVKLNLKFCRFY